MTAPSLPSELPRLGDRLGPYAIEDTLGRGGMGAVYRARHLESGAIHAVKVIALQPGADAERALARFRREVEVLARIAPHPHVVPIHACGVDRGASWCAMGLVPGQSLGEHLHRGALPIEAAVAVARKIADAVEHIHAHGVLHRDIKPENVIIDELGEPRLVDFGLAADVLSATLTETGQCIGTPAFMAPEQVGAGGAGVATTPATDVYGLGALLYAALTARPPFEGGAAVHLLARVVRERPAPLTTIRPDAPAALDAICQKALAKAPEDRYPSAAALGEDLRRFAAGEPVFATGSRGSGLGIPRSRPARAAFAVLVASLALAALAALTVLRHVETADAFLDRLERTLERGDALDDDDLAALDSFPAGSQDAPLRRAETLLLLDTLLRSDATTAEHREAASALAAQVRPDGALASGELELAARALHRAGRLGALNELLHGDEPIAAVPFELAADLARAIATARRDDGDDDVLLRAPIDDDAFAALRRAPGLDDATRGRLHLRRAGRLLDAAESRHDAALEDLVAAWNLGVALPRESVPPEFIHFFSAHFLERLTARAPAPELRTLADVIVASGRADVLVANEVYIGFRLETRAEDARDGEGPERLLEAEVVATALRFRVRSEEGDPDLALGGDRLAKMAAAERARPVGRRNVARLITIADRLTRVGTWEDARSAVLSALEGGIDEAWLHAPITIGYRRADLANQAWISAERAIALDHDQPPALRNARIPLLLSGKVADPRRRVELAALGLAWSHPLREIWDAHLAGKVRPPQRLAIPLDIARSLTRAIAALLAAETSCCEGAVAPSIDELLDSAVEMLRGARMDRIAGEPVRFAESYEVRADHHRRHRRWDASLSDYEIALGFIEHRAEPEIEARLSEKRKALLDERAAAGDD